MFYSRQYLKKLHMQERAIEEVKLAIKPFYQRRDINKDEYKEILRKAVQKVGSKYCQDTERFVTDQLLKALIVLSNQLKINSKQIICEMIFFFFLRMLSVNTLCSWSSGVPQQERRDQPSEGGQSG